MSLPTQEQKDQKAADIKARRIARQMAGKGELVVAPEAIDSQGTV
jgi:hypothetical protein